MGDIYLKCIDASGFEKLDVLTIGKIYKSRGKGALENGFFVINDRNYESWYFETRFEVIDWGDKFEKTVNNT